MIGQEKGDLLNTGDCLIKVIAWTGSSVRRSLHLYVLFITDQYQKKYWAGYIGR
jgi:hypothetical protein